MTELLGRRSIFLFGEFVLLSLLDTLPVETVPSSLADLLRTKISDPNTCWPCGGDGAADV